MGVIPIPATILPGRRSGYPTVNRMSKNIIGSDELERYQRRPPICLRSLKEKQSVVCGKSEGASPFEGVIRNVAQSLERPAWDREAAGGNPAIPTINLLPGGIIVVRPPVKRNGAGASPAWAAI